MRGFVISILAVTLVMVLVVLSMSLRNTSISTERALLEPLPLIYSSFLVDDVATEFNSLVGPGIALNETNASVILTVTDALNNYNHSSDIATYGAFLQGEMASRTASNISTNFTNVSAGTIRLFIDTDYAYTNDHAAREALFTRSGGTGATSYAINFTVYGVRQGVTHMSFNPSGTMNVTIRYTDLNGTAVEQGMVYPDQSNTFTVQYPGGTSMEVDVGLVSGKAGSMRIKSTGPDADTAWAATLPRPDSTNRLGYEYDATLDYVQGKVAKRCRIGK